VRVLLQSGFRPFFLLGSLYAAISLAAWLLIFAGAWELSGRWPAPYWHGHEMLFGFAVTAIAGFLLTAVPTWTDTPRLGGWPLAGLAAAWLAGRVALWLGAVLPGEFVALIDMVFLPLLAIAIGRPIWRSRARRNYPVVGVLLALSLANLGLHLGVLGDAPGAVRRCLLLALYLVLVLITIISGRIVPLFTRNALRGRGLDFPLQSNRFVEWALVPAMAGAVALAVLREGSGAAGMANLGCAALLVLRQAFWQPHRTLGQPILWVLHVGHGWLAIGFACTGIAWLTPSFPASTALHAFSAGAIGTIVIGVMSRVALGHTARAIEASPATVVAYALVILGGAIRVFGPLALPGSYRATVLWAGCCWAAGYLLFAGQALATLTRPRIDGQPG